jgi:uncharacterized membrane protein
MLQAKLTFSVTRIVIFEHTCRLLYNLFIMTTIDQRILIPAPPEVVWEYISDIRNNGRWQAGATGVVFLTSKTSGPGTRWRQTIDKSTEQVIEISAWYEGLGYQYTYIDGAPFRESTGRLRLQEIPEGTVVQWTITYEMGGLLGGVRNSLGVNRRFEAMMVDSLKALWKQISDNSKANRNREAKSLMRDAPDAEARANYKPRHTPVLDIRTDEDGPVRPPTPATMPVIKDDGDSKFRPPAGRVIPEPEFVEDDTRPRQPVESPAELIRPVVVPEPLRPRGTIQELVEDSEEPEFLQDLGRFAPPPQEPVSDTQPIRPITDAELAAGQAATPEPDFMDEFALDDSDFAPPDESEDDWYGLTSAEPVHSITDEINALVLDDAPPAALVPSLDDEIDALLADTPRSEIRMSDEIEPLVLDDAPPAEPALTDDSFTFEADADATPDTVEPPPLPVHKIDESSFPPPATTDTSKMSIWEIFGVPRPSETTEMQAITPEMEAAAAEADLEAKASAAEVSPEVDEVEDLREAANPDLSDETEAELPVAEAGLDEPEIEELREAANPDLSEDATVAPASEAIDIALAPAPTTEVTPNEASVNGAMSGELTIVEVIREVHTLPRRTGLRFQQRRRGSRLRRPQ